MASISLNVFSQNVYDVCEGCSANLVKNNIMTDLLNKYCGGSPQSCQSPDREPFFSGKYMVFTNDGVDKGYVFMAMVKNNEEPFVRQIHYVDEHAEKYFYLVGEFRKAYKLMVNEINYDIASLTGVDKPKYSEIWNKTNGGDVGGTCDSESPYSSVFDYIKPQVQNKIDGLLRGGLDNYSPSTDWAKYNLSVFLGLPPGVTIQFATDIDALEVNFQDGGQLVFDIVQQGSLWVPSLNLAGGSMGTNVSQHDIAPSSFFYKKDGALHIVKKPQEGITDPCTIQDLVDALELLGINPEIVDHPDNQLERDGGTILGCFGGMQGVTGIRTWYTYEVIVTWTTDGDGNPKMVMTLIEKRHTRREDEGGYNSCPEGTFGG